ncbi:formylmethanofuran dehydrogenase subunit B [Thiorhodococcus minor]|uniref:Formylmethanofuran dehydrogenase subunit B n=1 Tax=Thiorhodococcus minor TaxID=57489 RepID=A0A6M0K1J6_9GAMM|nr:formylmethanofuran dehydrogenase subunit B [Thiorhodococcus minor]NEV63628.1 formylmethanofuran dehydrogenase subunit B [Thiorhodococcus minor]
MWSTAAREALQPITCPFCGLLCDDLTLDTTDPAQPRLAGGCERARTESTRALTQASAHCLVDGAVVGLETALTRCAERLSQSQAPLLAGLATDVNGMRAALALADGCGATLDHMGGDALFRNLLVVQDGGWLTTTLTEARNRADLVLLVGTECHTRFPRLVERVLAPPEALFGEVAERHYVLLGPWSETAVPSDLPRDRTTVVEAPKDQLANLGSLLRGLVAGRPARADAIPAVDGAQLTALAEQLLQASYAVVVWSAGELAAPHAELEIQTWVELVRDLNETTRAAALPLAGTLGDITTNQVCTWQSGYPLRTSFQHAGPSYDPLLNRYQDLLAREEADCLLWIDAVSGEQSVPATSIPTLILGRADMSFERPPEVFIPVGVPGIHHPGHWYRSDAACPLPLGQLRDSDLPSVAQVLGQLLERLRAQA